MISGQASSKLSFEMRGFCVFSAHLLLALKRWWSETQTHGEQVFIRVGVFVVQIITNSQADLHSR